MLTGKGSNVRILSVSLFILFTVACFSQEVLVAHPTLRISDFPVELKSSGKQNEFHLTDFSVNIKEGYLVCDFVCEDRRDEGPEFLLMVYLAFESKLFLAYYTDEVRQVFITPSGSNGDVAFSMDAYTISEISSNSNRVTFELPLSMYGLWDIYDEKGTAYTFLISTDQDRQIENDTFISISNVVHRDF